MVAINGSCDCIPDGSGKSEGGNVEVPSSWNDTTKKGSMEEPIHQLMARRAVEDADRLAVSDDSCSMTYKGLNGRANGLAHGLKEWGICLETPVAVCMESSPEMVVCLLAVMKAGGCYTPIDPAYPDDRVSYILEDSGAPVLLTSDPNRFSSMKAKVIDPKGWQWEEAFCPRVEAGLEHRAYIIYTSGSTGRPKGVEVTHSALLNLINWHCSTWEVTGEDRATQIAGPAFDASVWEIWPYLAVGASVFIPRGETRLHPFQLMAWMKEHLITCAFAPTPLAEAILAESSGADLNLRVLLTGGDRLQRRPDKNFSTRFINAYGPTENTVVSTCCEVAPGSHDGLPPIGRPVDNTKAYIVDASGNPLPIGHEGELWVGGLSLARGYLGRPALTAEKFIPNPFGDAGSRLYRTGDLVRYNDQGLIQFVGRMDHQVKIRGFRIELGEIEWALSQHPLVQSCIVMVREDLEVYGIKGKVLIAYLITEKETPHDSVLREFLAERLPEYMVPVGFLAMEGFPTTPNGKVDRKVLLEMNLPNLIVDRQTSYMPPRNSVEKQLVQWWTEVLGVEKPGIRDNFFSLGGHSLLLARLSALMEERLPFSPPLSELFQRLTIEKQGEWLIAEMLSASMDQKKPVVRESLPRLDRHDHAHFPLSSAQKRLWFIDRMAPGSAVYNLPLAFSLEGDLDVGSFQRSLDFLIQRHEVLRTIFTTVDGEPCQIIGPPAPAIFNEYDLREEPHPEKRIQDLLLEEAGFSFNLELGPLVRFNLLQLGDERFLFQINMHHIIGDARSFQVFMEELGCCHEAFKNGETPVLPALNCQYVDYAAWEADRLIGDRMGQQLDWWTAHLADPPVLELPTDRPRPKRQTYVGREYRFTLPVNLSRKISVLANSEEATPFMTLLAAYLLLLRRFTNQEDLVVGFPNTNRDLPEVQGVMGFFINTLVPRFNLSPHQTVRELIHQVRTVILDVKSRSDLPLDKLVEALQPDRDLSRSVLFQAAFSYFSKSAVEPEFPGLKLERYFFDRGLAHFDQLLVVEETGEGFSGSLEYNADLFNPSTMERMAAHYVLILDDFTKTPNQPLYLCTSFPGDEMKLLMHDWNQTASPTRDLIAPQLFQESAAAYKDQDALVAYEKDGVRAITYQVLARRVDHLAAWLWQEGVRQETVIGICMNRSPEAIIAMLAIHALGGAYVPVDPIYPSDRVAFMVEDAGIGFFFTREEEKPTDLEAHGFKACILYMEPLGIRHDTTVLDWTVLDEVEPDPFPRLVSEENTAYFIFTSGSTGRPKGVPMGHGTLRNFIDWFSKAYKIDHRVQGSLVAGPAFDGTIMEIWPYISLGATIHIPPEEARLDPALLDRFFNENKITHTFCPTPIAEALMDAWDPALSELVCLITGGDRLRKRPQAAFRGELINVYGPSEASCIASFSAVSPQGTQLPDIGRVVQNAQFYITDAQMTPVPIGVPGELLIGGICLSPGYLGRASLASAQFVPDPFGKQPGSRLYKTGDRVRYQSHGGGTLEFIDRIDTQVKIRGVRIELGEIESCLYQCPEVEVALVMVREDSNGEKRLVAYIQPHISQEDEAVLNDRLRHTLLDLLPEYMVPDPFVFLDIFHLSYCEF